MSRKQKITSSFVFLILGKKSLTWVIAEALIEGAKRSCTNQKSCLSLPWEPRHLTLRIALMSLLFAFSFFSLYFACTVEPPQHRLAWVINHACDTPHSEMLCAVGIEALLLWSSESFAGWQRHSSRSCYNGVQYRMYWAFSFMCNLFSETVFTACCVKTYQAFKYHSVLVRDNNTATYYTEVCNVWLGW